MSTTTTNGPGVQVFRVGPDGPTVIALDVDDDIVCTAAHGIIMRRVRFPGLPYKTRKWMLTGDFIPTVVCTDCGEHKIEDEMHPEPMWGGICMNCWSKSGGMEWR